MISTAILGREVVRISKSQGQEPPLSVAVAFKWKSALFGVAALDFVVNVMYVGSYWWMVSGASLTNSIHDSIVDLWKVACRLVLGVCSFGLFTWATAQPFSLNLQ